MTTSEARLQHLRKIIDRADCQYYNTENPDLTDAQYDALKAELAKLAPDDERNTRVGPPSLPTILNKVKHTCFMGSLRKCDTEADLRKWYADMVAAAGSVRSLVVALKADGGSVAIYYKNGKLDKAVTRGGDDGVGEDITANAVRIIGIPTELPTKATIAVRGEVIMTVKNWQIVDPDQHSNPRNIGNGAMRRSSGEQAHMLNFVAFDVEGGEDRNTEAEKLTFLAGLGFDVIEHIELADIDAAIDWYHDVMKRRSTLPFWIDGIVFKMNDLELQRKLGIVSNRPRAQTVLKFEAEGTETTLLEVVLSMGHTGAIIPTGKVAPVRIGGTTVSSVLLNNFQMIADLDLAVGDKVRIIKAKDIIPKITEVIERPVNRKPILEPSKCPVCGGGTGRKVGVDGNDGSVTECKNAECSSLAGSRLKNWISKLDIMGIGDEVLDGLLNQLNVKTPADLYRLASEPARIAFFPGMKIGAGRLGAKRSKSIIDQINLKKSMPINVFMGALGIPHLGRRRAELIMEAVPGEFESIDDWLDSEKIKKFAVQASIPNVAAEIIAGIEAFQDEIEDLRQYVTIIKPEVKQMAATASKVFAGKTFCFTGKIEKVDDGGKRYTRDRMQQLVVDNGGSTMDDVRAGCTTLVQADPSSTSSKTQKAVKLGVEIMSEADFFAALGL